MTEMKQETNGPAFRLGTGSTATFSAVDFSNMQLSRSVSTDECDGDIVVAEGSYGPLGKLSASAAVNFIDCSFTSITVQVWCSLCLF
jgi:hypothetical protein